MWRTRTWMAIGSVWASGLLVGWCPSVHAQTAQDDRPSRAGESAEDLAEAALAKIDTGDYEQAAAILGKARRLNPKLAKLALVEGLLLMNWTENRNYAQAIQRLTEYCASREGGADYRGHAALGWIYKESRSYREAVRALEQTRKLAPLEEKGKPIRAQATLDLALAYLGLDRKKEAMDMAKEASSIASDEPKIQLGLARVAGMVQEYDVADAAAKRTVELLKFKLQRQPLDNEPHETLKQCYEVMIRIKNIALRTSPEDGALLAALASLWRDHAEVDRRIALLTAREYALQATQKDPKQHDWQVLTARIEMDLGATEDARRRLEETLQAAPDHQEAQKLLDGLAPAAGEPPTTTQP